MKCCLMLGYLLLVRIGMSQEIMAHAHNDYENKRPLWEALEYDFQSIEIDVFVYKDEIKVSHHSTNLEAKPTIKELYLDPLAKFVEANDNHQLWLLIDLKQDDLQLLELLHEQVLQYAQFFKSRKSSELRPLQIILSGSVQRKLIADSDKYEYFYLDGRLRHLESEQWDSKLMPLISANINKVVHWKGKGPISVDDQARLHQLVALAKAQGKKLRFWKTKDTDIVWSLLVELGLEVIGTDDIPKLADFLSRVD